MYEAPMATAWLGLGLISRTLGLSALIEIARRRKIASEGSE